MYYIFLILIIIVLLLVCIYLYYKMIDYEKMAKDFIKYTFFLWDENVELRENNRKKEKKTKITNP